MKLAAFARGLSLQPTGRGLLARWLLEGLQRVRPDWDIFLLSAADPGMPSTSWGRGRGETLTGDAVSIVYGITSQVRRYRADIFWGATHLLPFFLPAGLPKAVTFHDAVWRDHPETMNRRNRMASRAGERTLRRADHIFCNSEFTHSRLAAHWPGLASRATVMPLAANPHFETELDPAPTLDKLGIRPPYVVNVDTVEPRKNLSVFLDCAHRLPDVTFVQCGGIGWNVGDLVTNAREIPNLRMLGYVADRDLNALYLGAAAAMFPSVYEGFHLSTVDAARLGCPLVVSDIPVHREVLGDAARFADPSDSGEFEDCLRQLLADESQRQELQKSGRERAASFSWDKTAELFATKVEELA